jgi:leucyl aminopeptidase
MKITFSAVRLPTRGALAVLVAADRKLLGSAKTLDKATGGALTRAMKASDFQGKKDELLDLVAPWGLDNSRLLLVGLGDPKKLKGRDMQAIGSAIVSHLNGVGETQASAAVDSLGGNTKAAAASAGHLAYGARLQSYRFDRYKTKKKPDHKKPLEKLSVLAEDTAEARRVFAPLDKVAAGVHLTRDLVSEPANVIYPKSLVQRAKALQGLGVKVRALGVAEMKKLGMGALLGVGQGSARESQLLVLEWNGTSSGTRGGRSQAGRPVAFVGKGVTFDTGGISIKPAAGMEDMKWDMGGAGVVIGRPGREHAFGRGPAARRYRHLHVGADHRGAQYRRRRAPGPGRCPLVRPGQIPAEGHRGPGHPDRGHHRRPGPRARRPVQQQR